MRGCDLERGCGLGGDREVKAACKAAGKPAESFARCQAQVSAEAY
jgi:hypothetical protein